jgi:hypothetical protein
MSVLVKLYHYVWSSAPPEPVSSYSRPRDPRAYQHASGSRAPPHRYVDEQDQLQELRRQGYTRKDRRRRTARMSGEEQEPDRMDADMDVDEDHERRGSSCSQLLTVHRCDAGAEQEHHDPSVYAYYVSAPYEEHQAARLGSSIPKDIDASHSRPRSRSHPHSPPEAHDVHPFTNDRTPSPPEGPIYFYERNAPYFECALILTL